MVKELILPIQETQADIPAIQRLFKNASKPTSATCVCIIVPVRNEAEGIEETLDALRQQVDNHGNVLSVNLYEVLVLVNNCTDNSFQIVSDYQRRYPAFRLFMEEICLPSDIAHIGTVRRILMDEAYNRMLLAGNEDGIIASTDGDTIVDCQWVYNIMTEIAEGNDAVGGRILTERNEGGARLYHLRDVTYRCLLAQAESLIDPQKHDPFPCHFQYFGANMAVTCKMYDQAGRLPRVSFLEDMAFHKALSLQDARIRKSFKVKVYTSSRVNGRVSIGFSEQLKKWTEEDKARVTQMVERVEPALKMMQVRSRLRKCWNGYLQLQIIQEEELNSIAVLLNVKSEWLHTQVINSTYFGKLWDTVNQNVNSDLQQNSGIQPIQQAIEELRMFIRNYPVIAFQTDPNDTFLHAG